MRFLMLKPPPLIAAILELEMSEPLPIDWARYMKKFLKQQEREKERARGIPSNEEPDDHEETGD